MSEFTQQIQEFLSHPWQEDIENEFAAQIEKNKSNILSNSDAGKKYLKRLLDANKSMLIFSATDDFMDKLTEIIGEGTVASEPEDTFNSKPKEEQSKMKNEANKHNIKKTIKPLNESLEKLFQKDPDFILGRLDEFFFTHGTDHAINQWQNYKNMTLKESSAKDWIEFLENTNGTGEAQIKAAVDIIKLNGLDDYASQYLQLNEGIYNTDQYLNEEAPYNDDEHDNMRGHADSVGSGGYLVLRPASMNAAEAFLYTNELAFDYVMDYETKEIYIDNATIDEDSVIDMFQDNGVQINAKTYQASKPTKLKESTFAKGDTVYLKNKKPVTIIGKDSHDKNPKWLVRLPDGDSKFVKYGVDFFTKEDFEKQKQEKKANRPKTKRGVSDSIWERWQEQLAELKQEEKNIFNEQEYEAGQYQQEHGDSGLYKFEEDGKHNEYGIRLNKIQTAIEKIQKKMAKYSETQEVNENYLYFPTKDFCYLVQTDTSYSPYSGGTYTKMYFGSEENAKSFIENTKRGNLEYKGKVNPMKEAKTTMSKLDEFDSFQKKLNEDLGYTEEGLWETEEPKKKNINETVIVVPTLGKCEVEGDIHSGELIIHLKNSPNNPQKYTAAELTDWQNGLYRKIDTAIGNALKERIPNFNGLLHISKRKFLANTQDVNNSILKCSYWTEGADEEEIEQHHYHNAQGLLEDTEMLVSPSIGAHSTAEDASGGLFESLDEAINKVLNIKK
jgi:hypothetical protein